MASIVKNHVLSNEEIARYSRQIILPEVGSKGQENLKHSSVLIVGAGGLGCPVAIQLAAAGVGVIGVVDYDYVETSNLHRQILHTEEDVGKKSKVESVSAAIARLNSSVHCILHCVLLDSSNAMDIIARYDIIADCTDNVATRYLLNDACVILKKPLVSGSALRWEGQLTIYNFNGGPCYRCLFPLPPLPETVINCADGGVLGVVPGIIGNMQALEVLKILLKLPASFSGHMLLFDALGGQFKNIRLRGRSKDCVVCGDEPSITQLIDYPAFCGSGACDRIKPLDLLPLADRVSVEQYSKLRSEHERTLLLDVRPAVEFEIAHLPEAKNVAWTDLKAGKKSSECLALINGMETVYVVCHRGNDSQLAVRYLKHCLQECTKTDISVKDIVGGLDAWAKEVDNTFPLY